MKIAFRHTPAKGCMHRVTAAYIKWKLKTDYPHAGVVVDEHVLHCTLRYGLHFTRHDSSEWLIIDMPSRTDEQVLELYDAWKGARYDWASLLPFALPVVVRNREQLYCYEWVWLAMTGESPEFPVTPEKIMQYLLTRSQN
jgi:hypothetical protein